MDVGEALRSRYTCRAFLDTPVPEATVRAILEGATRAPSSGNLQPQHVWALTGAPLRALSREVCEQVRAGQFAEGETEYAIFPPVMEEPYAARRFQVGADMYAALGVERFDVDGLRRQLVLNFEMFGAPVGLFFAVDRRMGPGQWADLGLYVMAVMLLAREHGLQASALQSWATWPKTVAAHLGMPPELMLYCGMALGVEDPGAPVNHWRARRAGLEEFAVLLGFPA